MRIRRAVLVAVTPLLLTACGGDEPPTRSKDIKPGPTCATTGTVKAKPVAELEQAVEPYREPGDKLRITERFGDTAEVELSGGSQGEVPSRVTLLRAGGGWVVTSVIRCG
jgi:hypothetical protein